MSDTHAPAPPKQPIDIRAKDVARIEDQMHSALADHLLRLPDTYTDIQRYRVAEFVTAALVWRVLASVPAELRRALLNEIDDVALEYARMVTTGGTPASAGPGRPQ